MPDLGILAGLTPSEALASATSVPSRCFGLTERGHIAPGLRADLLLVAGDPTSDSTATREITGIWRCGVRLDRKAYVRAFSRGSDVPPNELRDIRLSPNVDLLTLIRQVPQGTRGTHRKERPDWAMADFFLLHGTTQAPEGWNRLFGIPIPRRKKGRTLSQYPLRFPHHAPAGTMHGLPILQGERRPSYGG